MNTTTNPLTAARAAALFLSHLSASAELTTGEVEAAIQQSVRTHGGVRGCAADLAACYGDHPELAAPRMRWAREVVTTTYRRQRVPVQQELARAA